MRQSILTVMITLLLQSAFNAQEIIVEVPEVVEVPDVTFVNGTEIPYGLVFTVFPVTTDKSVCQSEFDMIYSKLYATYTIGVFVESDITIEEITNLDPALVTDPTFDAVDQILDGTVTDATIVTTDVDTDGDVVTIAVDTSVAEDDKKDRRRLSSLPVVVKNNLRYQQPQARKLQTLCTLRICRRENQWIMDILECEEFCGRPPDRKLEIENDYGTIDESELLDVDEIDERDLQRSGRRRRGGKYRPLEGRGAETAALFYKLVDLHAVTDQCRTMLNEMTYEIVNLLIM